MHPPNPEMRRPATRQSDGAKIAGKEHKQPYYIPVDVQVFIAAVAPWCVAVLLLALAGGRQ
jgi:hypothetical protein